MIGQENKLFLIYENKKLESHKCFMMKKNVSPPKMGFLMANKMFHIMNLQWVTNNSKDIVSLRDI